MTESVIAVLLAQHFQIKYLRYMCAQRAIRSVHSDIDWVLVRNLALREEDIRKLSVNLKVVCRKSAVLVGCGYKDKRQV